MKYKLLSTALVGTALVLAGVATAATKDHQTTKPVRQLTVTADTQDNVPSQTGNLTPQAQEVPVSTAVASTPNTASVVPPPQTVTLPAPQTPSATPTIISETLSYVPTEDGSHQDAYCTYGFSDGTNVERWLGQRPTPTGHGIVAVYECPVY